MDFPQATELKRWQTTSVDQFKSLLKDYVLQGNICLHAAGSDVLPLGKEPDGMGQCHSRVGQPGRKKGAGQGVNLAPSQPVLSFLCLGAGVCGPRHSPKEEQCQGQVLALPEWHVNTFRAFRRNKKGPQTHQRHGDAGSSTGCSSVLWAKVTLLSLLCVHCAAGKKC